MQDGRAPRVKNRAPAAIQITAEQILREAQERQEPTFRAPKQRVEDFEELSEYQGRKRKEFEERIRRTRGNIKEWLQYANWEASQNSFDRSRSVFERALDVDPRSIQLWLSYTEMELKSRNVQHARNLFDRAVTLLPRVDQLWYKYVYLEELLQNVPGARQVFERWMQWEPDDKAWQAYIKMEQRYNEQDRASAIYERWVAVRPDPRVWVKWAKFEEERVRMDKAREVFQTALEFFGDEEEQVEKAQAVFGAFAKMETRQKEYERARVIYKFALERIPRSKSAGLYASYTKFEKQHGTRTTLENTVLGKRRIQYEEELAHDGRNYDVWFDYARLEEGAWRDLKEEGATTEEMDAAAGRVREVYERAVAQVPPGGEKRHWRRYIFLWLDYALFEEIETKDYDRSRQIYQTIVKLVPHKQFTFAKLWLMFAKFEVRRLDLPAARKILGAAIGMCPKEALFKGYIELEVELREFDRVRQLYQKYLEFDPSNSAAWIKYAELEAQLQDFARTRAIFKLGVSQSPLSMPEILWKAYIDFEIDEGERDNTRDLYEKLVAQSGHVKVWISYALFEGEAIPIPRAEREEEEEEDEDEEQEVKTAPGDPIRARQVFERGYKDLKERSLKNERVVLLETWKSFEETHGTPDDVAKVQSMMPIVSKRRHVDQETGQTVEDWDLVFADDEREANPTSFKFLQMAHAWKRNQAAGTTSGTSSAGGMLSGFVAAASAAASAPTRQEDETMDADGDEAEESDAASSRADDDD
ncbi:protein prenylyltransferase [Macrolepiota fuliginosa MF-IS2]|uniref:Pre-mRNA-splicing factor CLF1 n=1 Tax=Macrolepiota fuliginosa MF-IS2 TaxID=1400762 RepID=A0A9P5X6H3_9AGAR|nr:protein prenylyltransferase [Macrolepiota fuliginosa MF-IS2]